MRNRRTYFYRVFLFWKVTRSSQLETREPQVKSWWAMHMVGPTTSKSGWAFARLPPLPPVPTTMFIKLKPLNFMVLTLKSWYGIAIPSFKLVWRMPYLPYHILHPCIRHKIVPTGGTVFTHNKHDSTAHPNQCPRPGCPGILPSFAQCFRTESSSR